MVKKNTNFKFKGSMKKVEKKPRKTKSAFVPYDDSLFKKEDNTEDIVRTFLRDTRSYRSSSYDYYGDDSSSLW